MRGPLLKLSLLQKSITTATTAESEEGNEAQQLLQGSNSNEGKSQEDDNEDGGGTRASTTCSLGNYRNVGVSGDPDEKFRLRCSSSNNDNN